MSNAKYTEYKVKAKIKALNCKIIETMNLYFVYSLLFFCGLLFTNSLLAVQIKNIVINCPDGSTTAGCRCNDGAVQAHLGEECDLGKKPDGTVMNGLDEDGDGYSDYGCDQNCKISTGDPTKSWTCNEALNLGASTTIPPEKQKFNQLYFEMVDLYKEISTLGIDCSTATTSADRDACALQIQKAQQFISMNKHKPFLCDSFNVTDKISPKAFPKLTYYDILQNKNIEYDIQYEQECGLGNLLLEKTNFKWTHPTHATQFDYEAVFNCEMNHIKTLSGKYVRHRGWVMYFADAQNSTENIQGALDGIPNQVTFANYFAGAGANKNLAITLNDILFCIRKLEPTDPKAAAICDNPNLCYSVIAKDARTDRLVLKVFNLDFDFSKDTAQASGVAKFPTAIDYYNAANNIAAPSPAPAMPEVPGNNGLSAGYFTIYPNGSTFPWMRPL